MWRDWAADLVWSMGNRLSGRELLMMMVWEYQWIGKELAICSDPNSYTYLFESRNGNVYQMFSLALVPRYLNRPGWLRLVGVVLPIQ